HFYPCCSSRSLLSSFDDSSGSLRTLHSPCPFRGAPAPLRASFGTFARRVVNTSVANAFVGSLASTASHRVFLTTHVKDRAIPTIVPRTTMTNRGGKDFFVGTIAGSRTFTVGISLASCTLASSYCCVSSSYTVSWILV